jgi:hypothetical protein
MDNLTVGMENLPNVFIDKIILSPGTYGEMEYKIKLCMYDHRPKRSWHNRDDLTGLRVKVALVSSDSVIAGLNSGQENLQNYDTSEYLQIISASDFNIEQDDAMQDFSKFTKIVTFKSPAIFNNLNVYVVCFNDFGPNFDLGSSLFNKFYGPMAAEKIFVGGQQNELSGYFYYPDSNKEYGGPVHTHDGSLMVGSQHRDVSHASLEYVAEENNKIVFPMRITRSPGAFQSGTNSTPDTLDPTHPDYDPNATLTGIPPSTPPPGWNLGDPLIGTPASTPGATSVSDAATDPAASSVTQVGNQTYAQDLLADVSFEIRDAIRKGRSY